VPKFDFDVVWQIGSLVRDLGLSMISVADIAKPTLRLALGSSAYNSISRVLAQVSLLGANFANFSDSSAREAA